MEIKKPDHALPGPVSLPRKTRIFPKVLIDHMKEKGWWRKPGETNHEWAERCKQILKTLDSPIARKTGQS